ncbi:MAG: ribonuclease E [Alphaproteobacteria bacterium]|nr:ribonuclease E [Alphaproteobacteria bacterium]MBV9693651.1 ribonuclease E [Alphaproteobacteria bacterium]
MSDIYAFWDDAPDRGAAVVAGDVFGDFVKKDGIVYLDQGQDGQNWAPKDSLWFDNVAQGSDLVPYDFFLVLEQPDGSRIRSDANMNNRYRYLPRHATYNNPDALPIGLVKDFYDGRSFMGFTCAACHTGQINYRGTGIRIDGAPAMADMDAFLNDMSRDLSLAQKPGPVHDRFVRNVLALGHYKNEQDVDRDLSIYALRLLTYRIVNKSDTAYGYARLDAFGRIYNQVLQYVLNVPDIRSALDEAVADGKITADELENTGINALLESFEGKILNGADRDQLFQKLALLHPKQFFYLRNRIFIHPNAPVSYPFLWDIPQHDYVQWNGIAANSGLGPIGRNTGEVIGVFGTMDWSRSNHWTLAGYFSGQGLFNTSPIDFSSSVNIHNLGLIEHKLATLWSPKWPAKYFGSLDGKKVRLGEAIFARYCQGCHANIDRSAAGRRVVAHMSAQSNIGTDPQMAVNSVNYVGYSGILRNTYVDVGPGSLLLDKKAPVAALLTKAGRGVVATSGGGGKSWLRSFFEWLYDVIFSLRTNDIQGSMKNGDYHPDTTQAPFASVMSYKGRSLNGIWATAPYLHNGSVPTLYDLLLPAAPMPGDPADSKYRPKTFTLGSREFDPVKVGFMPTKVQGASDADPCPIVKPPAITCFVFRTEKLGNSNAGHEYGARDRTLPDGTVLKALTDPQRWALVEYLKSL